MGRIAPLPLVEEISPMPSAEAVFLQLCRLPRCLWLDSAQPHPALGRYALLAADPFDWLERPADGSDALGQLAERLAPFRAEPVAGLPPLQGGAAGLFGYELGRSLEHLPRPRYDEFQVPALAVGLYDVVVAFDHAANRAWLVSQGFPELEPARRRRRAEARLRRFRELLAVRPTDTAAWNSGCGAPENPATAALPAGRLAPQFPAPGPEGLTSDFSRDGYLRAVEQVVQYIAAGDVFQVNLSQRLLFPAADSAVSLYRRLRQRNPAPFAGYFDLGPLQILSASPERFLRVANGSVETRPIKGTRPRTGRDEVDRAAADALRGSEKDRAENVMIVDLLRNDLSRVCRPESVKLSQLCEVEAYQYVLHLVSAVVGRLREGCGPIDLLRAAFPGGSVTGAPKVRAMEIIAELEPTARGAYCGSLGYLGFDGALDLSILIRTITRCRGWLQLPVGGGIVAQSDPRAEYEETMHKAEGLIRALR